MSWCLWFISRFRRFLTGRLWVFVYFLYMYVGEEWEQRPDDHTDMFYVGGKKCIPLPFLSFLFFFLNKNCCWVWNGVIVRKNVWGYDLSADGCVLLCVWWCVSVWRLVFPGFVVKLSVSLQTTAVMWRWALTDSLSLCNRSFFQFLLFSRNRHSFQLSTWHLILLKSPFLSSFAPFLSLFSLKSKL